MSVEEQQPDRRKRAGSRAQNGAQIWVWTKRTPSGSPLCVTEACTNLLKHAGGARSFCDQPTEDPMPLGSGNAGARPGARHGQSGSVPARRLQHGRISGTGSGRDLRLSNASDFYSAEPAARRFWRAGPPALQRHRPRIRGHSCSIGAVNVSKPGAGGLRGFLGRRAERSDNAQFWSPTAWATGSRPGCIAAKRSGCCMRIRELTAQSTARTDVIRPAQYARRGRVRGPDRSGSGADRHVRRRRQCFRAASTPDAKASQHLVSVNGTAGHQIRADPGVQLSVARRRHAGDALRRAHHRHRSGRLSRPGAARSQL